VIDVSAIGQEDIGKGAPVLVLAIGLEHDFFPKDQRWYSLLRSLAVGLVFSTASTFEFSGCRRQSAGTKG